MSTALPSARLYFLPARRAPVGVIFRRGPSKWVQLIRWDTETDTFEPGQWFHGRVYEKRCDLSPDGSKLIYFAHKFNRKSLEDTEGFAAELRAKRVPRYSRHYTYAWTAISRPPYFTALALWPKADCWHGGGLFDTDRRIWLNHLPGLDRPHEDHKPHGLEVRPNPHATGEDDPVLYPRLVRDGWRHVQEWQGQFVQGHFTRRLRELMAAGEMPPAEMLGRMLDWDPEDWTPDQGYVTEAAGRWEKPSSDSQQMLRMGESISGFRTRYDFEVRVGEQSPVAVEGAAWADWDHRGRLVFVREGKLFAAEIGGSGMTPRELADFNAAKPEAVEAPEWARRW